jgi:hypothetical protein
MFPDGSMAMAVAVSTPLPAKALVNRTLPLGSSLVTKTSESGCPEIEGSTNAGVPGSWRLPTTYVLPAESVVMVETVDG